MRCRMALLAFVISASPPSAGLSRNEGAGGAGGSGGPCSCSAAVKAVVNSSKVNIAALPIENANEIWRFGIFLVQEARHAHHATDVGYLLIGAEQSGYPLLGSLKMRQGYVGDPPVDVILTRRRFDDHIRPQREPI